MPSLSITRNIIVIKNATISYFSLTCFPSLRPREKVFKFAQSGSERKLKVVKPTLEAGDQHSKVLRVINSKLSLVYYVMVSVHNRKSSEIGAKENVKALF
jgi:hypothetical protein